MQTDLTLIATRPGDYQALGGANWRGYHLPEGGLEPPEVLEMLAGWTARLHAVQGWGSWVAVAAGVAAEGVGGVLLQAARAARLRYTQGRK